MTDKNGLSFMTTISGNGAHFGQPFRQPGRTYKEEEEERCPENECRGFKSQIFTCKCPLW
jgi:hypothetical protein